MPTIEIKTNKCLSTEEKTLIADALIDAFARASDPIVANNMQVAVEDGCYLRFHGDSESPAASVRVNMGRKTPEEDYEAIVREMFVATTGVLGILQDRTYVAMDVIGHWGYNGGLVKLPPKVAGAQS